MRVVFVYLTLSITTEDRLNLEVDLQSLFGLHVMPWAPRDVHSSVLIG
jgi:hypothetical protein